MLQFLMNRPSKRYVETMSALISRKNETAKNELEQTRVKLQSWLDKATANHEEAKVDYQDQINELKKQLDCFRPLADHVKKPELKRKLNWPPHRFSKFARLLRSSLFSYAGHALYCFEVPDVESDYKLKLLQLKEEKRKREKEERKRAKKERERQPYDGVPVRFTVQVNFDSYELSD